MNYWQQRIHLLKHSSFRWYLISCLLATLGGGMSFIALTWYVLQINNSLAAVVTTQLCFWLPSVIVSPIAGICVDRFNRRTLLIINDLFRALAFISFGFFFIYHDSLWLCYFLTAINGVTYAFYSPTTFTLIREIVGKDDLLYANATIDSAYEIGNIAGMGLAGVVVSFIGPEKTLIIVGALLALGGLCLFRVNVNTIVQENIKTLKSFFSDYKDSLQYLKKERNLCKLYAIQLIVFIQYMIAPIILAPFVKNNLHGTASTFGHIEAFLSLGVVIGGIILPYWASRKTASVVIITCIAVTCVSFISFGFNYHIATAELIYLLLGITFGAWPLIMTQAQHRTELAMQGRVQASFMTLSSIGVIAMYLLANLTSRYISLEYDYWFAGFLGVIALLLAYRFRHLLSENSNDSSEKK